MASSCKVATVKLHKELAMLVILVQLIKIQMRLPRVMDEADGE